MAKSELSTFLKERRIKAEFTQHMVAEKLGYSSPQFISNWERGISNPPIETLKVLCQLYAISKDDIYEIYLQSCLVDLEKNIREKFYSSSKKNSKS